jgi:hypothetical protein
MIVLKFCVQIVYFIIWKTTFNKAKIIYQFTALVFCFLVNKPAFGNNISYTKYYKNYKNAQIMADVAFIYSSKDYR